MSELMERLRRVKENRGLMADLRCYLVAGKRHRAWPALSRLNIPIGDENKSMVAALFATHPEEGGQGNLGATCRLIEKKKDGGSGDDKLSPTERRFQHLLAAEVGQELFDRVTRMILLAKSQGIPVNYGKLENDLHFWNDRTRREWASSFWTPYAVTQEGGQS
ncbi:MAG: type I-E CRISPR-associated protein Cse2/CasB [Holophaga sp.]|nr:type I-E CRISPR-associated protein Cse2/CasB [Holophaga sp.]